MILVDSSAWIELFRASGSPAHRRLSELTERDGDVAVTEPVVAEVAMGARNDKREATLRQALARFVLLPVDASRDFDAAVRVYRSCRRAGVTPRGLVDCLIVAVALRNEVPVLAHDADLARISKVMPLELDEASLQPEK